jgi:general secretion pathway protein G
MTQHAALRRPCAPSAQPPATAHASTRALRAPPRARARARARATARPGFTLIEILVVIAVIAVLAALVAPNVFRHVGGAKDSAARAQVEMLGAALDAYRLDNGRYPTTSQGLDALMGEPTVEPRPTNWRGPYLRRAVPLDPWGNAYWYESPGTFNPRGYDLVSFGADGQPGGEGEDADITSW